MAYNDMSSFLPSKSAYTNPGEYETTQRNIALSKGTYMAEMDKLYAQIDETARQFDLSYGLDTDKFEFASGLETDKFLESIRQFDVTAELEKEKIDVKRDETAMMAEYYNQLNKSEEQNRTFDLIGGVSEILDSFGGLF